MAIKVYRITEAEADLLRGQEFDTDSYFNPTLDADGFWFISDEEVKGLKKSEFDWIKNKTKVDWKNKDKDKDPFTV